MSRSSVLAPLAPRPAAEAIAARLRSFREQGVLGSLEVHVVDHLGALVEENDPEVLLALALAVRAPTRGHICVDLGDVDALPVLAEDDACVGPEQLPWPGDASDWIARVARSPLVRSPDAADRTPPFVLDGSLLYSDRYFSYQEQLARVLRERVESQRTPRDRQLLQRGLGALFDPVVEGDAAQALDRQKLGAAMAMLRGLTVISGGPGTGKTYTIRTLLTLLWAQWAVDHDPDTEVLGPRVALAAPTGKAAARMEESLGIGLDDFLARADAVLPPGRTPEQLRAFLTGLEPSTIHRLLGWRPQNPSRFWHDALNPVPHEVVIVDEASMIDFALMAKLALAVAPDARLILLGDQHQLASVEAGTVLADMCGPTRISGLTISAQLADELREQAGVDVQGQAGVEPAATPGPHDAIVQLDRSRRFSPQSGIGRFAQACLADDFDPEQTVAILEDRFDDVKLLPHERHAGLHHEVERAIIDGYRPALERLLAGPRSSESPAEHHAAVLEALGGFRVLCAHRRGRDGVAGMNASVAALLEHERDRLDRDPDAPADNPLARFRPRGEFWVGRPVLVLENDPVVRRFNGDVGIVVPGREGRAVVAFSEAGKVSYLAPSRLPAHETVFAMTIHKSQGSEFQHALVMLPQTESPILTRELVYTAVTRAQERMILVGDRKLLARALGRSVRRASGLEAALWDAPFG
jgi:exodeoxyribonuclease V alpha subunit